MAWPRRNQKDYDAVRSGLAKDIRQRGPAEAERKKEHRALNKPVEVTNEELLGYVNEIFAAPYRLSSYLILKDARTNRYAVKAYYYFVNAYLAHQSGDSSMGKICCLAVDRARYLLRTNRMVKGKRRKRLRKSN